MAIPSQRLAAALVLVKRGNNPQAAAYCLDWLLDADPAEIAPVATLLDERMPDLPLHLEPALNGTLPAQTDRERSDRRRAKAACILILLGHGERGWPLLRFEQNPQARSFLIHMMGPAGIKPLAILQRLADAAVEASVRRALIQSLGEVPDRSWTVAMHDGVSSQLSRIYEEDPDAGVHSSAKWVLLADGARAIAFARSTGGWRAWRQPATDAGGSIRRD